MSDKEENFEDRRGIKRQRGKRGGGPNRGKYGYERGKRGNRGNRGNRGRGQGYFNKNNSNNRNRNFDRSNIEFNDDNSGYNNNQKEDKYSNKNNNYNNNFRQNEKKEKPVNSKKEKDLFFHPKEIKELETKEIIDLIVDFNKDDKFTEKVNGTNFQKDDCYTFMNIIYKISESNHELALITINKIIENTNFINKTVVFFLKEQEKELEFDNQEYLLFLKELLLFLQKYLIISSKKLEINYKFDKPKAVLVNLESKDIYNEEQKLLMKEVIQEINNYEKKMNAIYILEYEKKQREKEENKMLKHKNKRNYKDVKTIIDINDFFVEVKYDIDPNLIKGEYDSYQRYINTMFFLEYEDCYRNLRRAIYKLKDSAPNLERLNLKQIKNFEKKQKDIYCYFNGEIKNIEINNEGVFITIDFSSLSEKTINFSKRMINGSLVVLTNNGHVDYLLTIVSYNPYIEKKLLEKSNDGKRKNRLELFEIPKEPRYRIKLEVINLCNDSFSFMLSNKHNLQIFESKAYFQSYIHILNRIQNLVIDELPFENEIIKGNFQNLEINNPSIFLYNNSLIKPDENIFPDSIRNNLDESQIEAVKHCLTSKIALIQGPPGTGKTHLGTIVTNIFRQNLIGDSKILVVCYTNHALDQFLESILKYDVNKEDIVRIGGRCKSEIVKELVINNSDKYKDRRYREIENKINQYGSQMESIIKLVQNIKESILDELKEKYPKIYKKIINDFFKILNIKKEDYIPKYQLPEDIYKNYRNYNEDEKTQKLNDIKEEIIGDKIYKYWSNIGNKNFHIIDLITSIFDKMNLDNKNEIYRAASEFKNCAYDDNKLLDSLKFFDKKNVEKKENEDEGEEGEEIEDNNEESEEEGFIYDYDYDYDDDEIFERANNSYEDMFKEDNLKDENEIFKNLIFDLNDEVPDTQKIELTDEKINYLIDENKNINFFKIGQTLIKLIINYIKIKLINNILSKKNSSQFQTFTNIIKLKHEFNILYDAQIIKQKQIVAMTTTGCAKYAGILEQLNFEVIIIEEAAEVLEPHILSLLTKNTKRLIMLGDHKQLRPKTYSYEMAKNYNFDVSMFERLINNNIKYVSLKYQRRMKPLFANFVRLIYGKENYIDKVEERENVKGLTSDFYIITHNELEEEKEGMRSKLNDYEAQYLVKLCEYLIKQGYKNSQITILTFYLGQVITIMSYLKKSSLKDLNIKVSSVDNYQGEENDIILLSLVRSNKEKNIGFLKNFNRVCVAFSRAKLGFYVIGNIDSIIEGINKLKKDYSNLSNNTLETKMFDVWENIKKEAINLKLIGKTLKLKCQNHGTITEINNYKDFIECPEGGCKQKCGKMKKCGHICEIACHNFDCNEIKCTKNCNEINN